MMFVRRSTYLDLKARHEHTVAQLAAARQELGDWKGAAIRTAGRNTKLAKQLTTSRTGADLETAYASQLEARLARVLRACVRYRADLRRLTRHTDRLQRRYDDAVGLTSTALDDGARWRERRADKPRLRP